MACSQHCAIGKSGEDLACDELTSRGYAVLERRYRTRAGEIDIVARDGTALVFVLTAVAVSTLVPAWRASRMDPLRALRHQ